MSPIQVLEVVLSLSVQIAVLVGLTHWLARRNSTSGVFTERLWTTCLIAVCTVIPMALALPSLRLMPAAWLNSVLTTTGTAAFHRLAWAAIAIWATGAGLALLALVSGWSRTVRFLKRSVEPVDPQAEDVADVWMFETAQTRTSGPSDPVLLVSRSVSGPFCWQFHRPIVVLPESVLEFPRVELALMIRHELIHLSRQHPLQLFLQKLLDVAFWFHPMVRHLSRQLDRSRELLCDQLAIADSVEAHAYLSSLLRLAEGRAGDDSLHDGTLGFLSRRKSWIQDRVAAIADSQWKRRTVTGSRCRQTLILTLALMLCPVLRIPIETDTSRTELLSPWPQWSANALHSLGIDVRDYEPDWFSTPQHEHHIPVMPDDYNQASESKR
jgi:bla regulator protein BlaR1